MKRDIKKDRNLLAVSDRLPEDQVGKTPHAFVIPVGNHMH